MCVCTRAGVCQCVRVRVCVCETDRGGGTAFNTLTIILIFEAVS